MRAEREGMDCMGCPRSVWADGGCKPSKPVFGFGSTASGIAFVGEAPALTEVFRGEPLVGATGWWFRTILGDAKLPFDSVYRTNAVLCAGQTSEIGRDWPAVDRCSSSLQHEARALVAAGVKVFVAMGNAAIQGLLPGAPGVTFARGYVYPWGAPRAAWVVPTFHPSPKNLKGKGSGWALMLADILKAKRLVAAGGPTLPTFKRILNPKIAAVHSFFAQPRPLVVDIENTMDGRIVCIGFCDGEQTLVLPLLVQHGGEYWSREDWVVVQPIVAHVLAEWPTIYQNCAHDIPNLERAGFRVGRCTFDTMLADHACYPDQLHSLHHIASRYHEGLPWKPYKRRAESTEAEVMT